MKYVTYLIYIVLWEGAQRGYVFCECSLCRRQRGQTSLWESLFGEPLW
jgi:hypothetical protein